MNVGIVVVLLLQYLHFGHSDGLNLVTFVQPSSDDSLYSSGTVPLQFNINDSRYELGPANVLCVDVIWAQGEQSFCKDRLDGWVLKGLDSGKYMIRASLHSINENKNVIIDEKGFVDPASVAIVDSVTRHFTVKLDEVIPKVHVTWPRGGERVVLDKENDKLEVSYRATDFNDGNVCLTTTAMSDAQFACAKAGESRAVVQVGPGKNEVTALLVHNNGQVLEGEFAISKSAFDVVFSTTKGSSIKEDLGKKDSASFGFDGGDKWCNKNQNETMNVVVISARTVDRYEEALVMIKSMLFHWGRRESNYLYLQFHFVVDNGGRNYFEETLLTSGISRVCATFYEYDDVCSRSTDNFLKEFGFGLSAHYSGKAGYCRLFLPGIIMADKFIAIESDQIFFDDVSLLFKEFDGMVQKGVLIGAPEMYQPWVEGRPRDDDEREKFDLKLDGKKNTNLQNTSLIENSMNADDDWHGNGYIGGIMAFSSAALLDLDWESLWKDKLKIFIAQSGDHPWAPKLNDQDVFNAVLSLEPRLAGNLDCSWNLQYHAFMNTQRLCSGSLQNKFNCDASLSERMFSCPRRPKVVHFMSGSYKQNNGLFYSQFWDSYEKISMKMLSEPINFDTRILGL